MVMDDNSALIQVLRRATAVGGPAKWIEFLSGKGEGHHYSIVTANAILIKWIML